MIHPHTELKFINETKGHGVVATQFIPKVTITWTLDKLDKVLSPQEVKSIGAAYLELLHKYTYCDSQGGLVLCWDHARFINHSFNSNCMSTAYELELAIRDIQPGEELTDDYGYLNVIEPTEYPAETGSPRRCVYPNDILIYHSSWDQLALASILDCHYKNVPSITRGLTSWAS
ncbi:MAG: SET domain-containing protein [Bdellovibrionia bacterium]